MGVCCKLQVAHLEKHSMSDAAWKIARKKFTLVSIRTNLYLTVIMGQRQSILGDVVVISICPMTLRHAI